MKSTKIIFSIGLILAISTIGCNKQSASDKLEKHLSAIETLSEETVNNAEEAFQLLRSFNSHMKDIKNSIMNMESKYNNADNKKEKEKIKIEFDTVNNRIKKASEKIYHLIEPYKNNKNVIEVMEKINEVLIAQ